MSAATRVPVVGIIGAGQLARMCVGPATELGIPLALLADSLSDSAAQVIRNVTVGDYRDVDQVLKFAADCDVITFDHEHVPVEVLDALLASGVGVHPSPDALRYAQNKIVMRQRMEALGIPSPRWREVTSPAELADFVDEVGGSAVLKRAVGGYDGRGVAMVTAQTLDDVADWFDGTALLAEERVEFERELAAVVARSPMGQAAAWPVVETVQTDGICTEVIAPAPHLHPGLAAIATEAALTIAGELGVTGVLAVEMFQIAGDGFVVNELAMRPHNSGHWSMDGAVTGQFEQHLRAILDLPLGSPAPTAPFTVMANILGGDYPDLYAAYKHIMAREPRTKVHLYGKQVRPGRKVGHVAVSGSDLVQLREQARHAADYFQGVITQ